MSTNEISIAEQNSVVEATSSPTINDTTSIMAVISRAASDPACDVDKMERLLDLKDRMETKAAEQAFNVAMRDLQSEIPRILKDAENGDNHSKYARLETINRVIKPLLAKYGFSQSFGTDSSPIAEHYRVTCILSHIGGHSRNFFADVPRDNVGLKGNANKTPTHGFGSSLSYGRRYLTVLIFNLELSGEDDDGCSAGASSALTIQQYDKLVEMLEDTKSDPILFVRFMGLDPKKACADIPMAFELLKMLSARKYEYAVRTINEVEAKKTQNQKAK